MSKKQKKFRRKSRWWSKGKIFGVVFFFALILGVYGAWQYTQPSTEPPEINPANPLQTPYNFTLKDVNGTQFSLNSFIGKVVLIHVMAVGCHGQIAQINDNQLRQLKTVCNNLCGSKSVILITVAVATCPSSDLRQIRTYYGMTWLFGNDYDDGRMDIAQNYATEGDGTIVLIDKTFHISNTYGKITASTLLSKINELLGA